MKLHVFDVCHGDSILLEFPNASSFGIIDCNNGVGQSAALQRSAKRGNKTLNYFKTLLEKGVTPAVEFVCLTHPHYDHYSGLSELLDGLMSLNIPVRQYWDFGISAKKAKAMANLAAYKEQQDRVLAFVELCHTKRRLGLHCKTEYRVIASPQKAFWQLDDVIIDTIAPSCTHFENYSNYQVLDTNRERHDFSRAFPYSSDDNIICSGLAVRYGEFQLILGADMTNLAWKQYIDSYSSDGLLTCHALKVSHHGSLAGNFPEPGIPICNFLLREEASKVAVISGGYRTHSPHPDVVTAFKNRKINVYCTGPISKKEPTLYIPEGVATDQEVIAFLKIDDVRLVEENVEQGHGDILLECSKTGLCKVSVENELLKHKSGSF